MLLTPELEQMSTTPSASIKASAGREQPEQPVRALAEARSSLPVPVFHEVSNPGPLRPPSPARPVRRCLGAEQALYVIKPLAELLPAHP